MRPERRQISQTAVIDVGSHAVRMDIFETSDAGAPRLLESLMRDVDLGREVFRRGEVPPGELALLCGIAEDFRRKLDEYGAIPVRAFATSALREAVNRELVADRMYGAGGWKPEILESSRECYLVASAMRRAVAASGLTEERVLGIHVGSGSLFMVFFDGGVLCFGEEIPVGRDRLPAAAESLRDCARVFGEAIAASGAARRFRAVAGEAPPTLFVSGSGARRFAAALGHAPAGSEAVAEVPLELLRDCGVVDDAGSACAMMTVAILEYDFEFDRLFVPGFTTRSAFLADGAAVDEARFAADLAGVCRGIVKRFGADAETAERGAGFAAALWKKLRGRFDLPERSLALLECAARLRNLGSIVDCRETARHSGYFIDHLQLPGVSSAERRLVAATVRRAGECGSGGDAESLTPEHRPTLFKLAVLLRVGAALARIAGDPADSHLNISGTELTVTSRTAATEAAREFLVPHAEEFFRVFGLRPRLGEPTA
jgi:exopolyphosphatase/pppGpp-phosphohydrolase